MERMQIFCEQIEKASSSKQKMVIMGDANLCTEKWDHEKFRHKNVSNLLRETLEKCDLDVNKVGTTYIADHVSANNTIPESSLDHVYSSDSMRPNIKIKTLGNSSSDHFPVIAKFDTNKQYAERNSKI